MNDSNAAQPVLGDFSEFDLPEIKREEAQRLGKVAAPPNKESTSGS